MADLILLPPAAKYLKKLKDKPLKKLYDEAIKEISFFSYPISTFFPSNAKP